MELERRDFRAMIFYDFKKGLTQEQCHVSLVSAFSGQAPSRATVFNWFAEFKRGRQKLKDEAHTGRIPHASTMENTAAVQAMVNADRRVTYLEIERSIGISATTISTILHKHLGLSKRCCRWIPHHLTNDQKEARVTWSRDMLEKFNGGVAKSVYNIVTGDESWIYQYDPETKQQSSVWCLQDEAPPTKVVRSRSVGKMMVASFFGKTGHITSVPLENQGTVTAEWYVTTCIPKVFQQWRKHHARSGIRRILWHHDNAPAHKAARTNEFFEENGVQMLSHPPYSPDLAPCDFFLFPVIKKKLRGKRFPSPEDAVNAFITAINDMPGEEWDSAFQKWFVRMKLCVECGGEYFEKL